MNVYRAHFGRLLALDERIRNRKYPNCSSFAREYEVSAKTVQRDIEFLRDNRGAPIEYDHDRRGYYYADAGWRLTALELTDGDLFELAIAKRMAEQYRGTPLAGALDGLFAKIRDALPTATSIDPIAVQTGFSFHGHPTREVDEETWRTVAKALRDRRILDVRYRSYGAARAKRRRLIPVHLTCLDGEWVLVASMPGRPRPVTFALSRMRSVAASDDAAPAVPFDPAEFFSNRFGRFVGTPGRTHGVVVRFDASAAPGVMERRWHPRQKVRREKDGSVVLSFPAPAIYEAKRWVLQWGAAAEVLAPDELRTAVAASARRLRAVYRKRRSAK